MTNPTPRTAAQSDGAMREIGCPHDSWGAVFPCPTCGTPRSLVPATRQRVAAPDAALRDALERIANDEPPTGGWDGWRNYTRLKDEARAALAALTPPAEEET